MHYRNEKPLAATALVVALVFGVGAVIRLIHSTYEPNIGLHPPPLPPLWVMAGE